MKENNTTVGVEQRIVWVDWLRVAACFMVIVVHSTEPFYLGGEGSRILTTSDAHWAAFFDSFVRACVPLFIVASSYLQFPLRYSTGVFLRRRSARVLVPFLLWTIVYALVWGEPVQNFRDLMLNFNYAAGHLWFVYMLAGVYLLMPLLSPWAERVSRRELSFYLLLCLLTSVVPLIREWAAGGPVPVVHGVGGIPNTAIYPLWGECSWNAYGVFYYLSGFIGYLLLGLYLRRFVGNLSWGRTLLIATPSWLAGFAIAFGGFLTRVFATSASFPIEGSVDLAVWWETTWCNDTIGVALMTIGWLLLFRKCTAQGQFYRHVLLPISRASYGMYLCHLLVLVSISEGYANLFGLGSEGRYGLWTTPIEILLSAATTFALTALVCTLLYRIPRLGKWVVG